ncbi:hypothetical protein IJG78_00720 [Candidatus Saccharibacteria bacterium]|nr:hypothetical protein [Candidatus Saccharibacteria bacterium]
MDFIKEIDAKVSPIQYGWVDHDGTKYTDMSQYAEKYILQAPDQLLKSCLGVCWDQVELQRKLFANAGVTTRSFFIVHYDEDKCPTHTFTIFEYGGKTFWYEHAWTIMRGLHEYDNLRSAVSDIRDKFIQNELNDKYNPQNLVIYEYKKPPYGLSCSEFYKHCEKGQKVKISSL